MNGWRNAETWTVNLWFGDTFAAMADAGDPMSADACREMVEEYAEEALGGTGGFVWDMMNLGAVDWQELADHHEPEEDTAKADAQARWLEREARDELDLH